jgi:hypothetical protein
MPALSRQISKSDGGSASAWANYTTGGQKNREVLSRIPWFHQYYNKPRPLSSTKLFKTEPAQRTDGSGDFDAKSASRGEKRNPQGPDF